MIKNERKNQTSTKLFESQTCSQDDPSLATLRRGLVCPQHLLLITDYSPQICHC